MPEPRYDPRWAADARPIYKALGELFIAPHIVKKGAIFSSKASPAECWEPLNHPAWELKEAWFEEERPEIDAKTMLPVKLPDGTISMWKPHAKYRTAIWEQAEPAEVTLIMAPPPDDMTGTLDLAQARYAPGSSGELRPAPDPVYSSLPQVGENGEVILPASPPVKAKA